METLVLIISVGCKWPLLLLLHILVEVGRLQSLQNYLGFVHLAAVMTLLRGVLLLKLSVVFDEVGEV